MRLSGGPIVGQVRDRAAVTWQDMDHIDLDGPWKVLLTRWTAADEPHHLIRDGGDHIESVRGLQ